ncbi:AbrB/MazE/SpoVT family DNA-binding domain-containing protein [Sandaracinobacter neustonicus]|uniref:AbrB/MazE/SpoVT family DNA-binding domain-containing protein n=1 Tax=Sandaracinobacter neustonicus TaxID=1715348 RepID=A0A501XJW9_9SPHN|nr:AbrB/MazE/SpoVT family DNA-binding domain-containing protein [Sandaracinobacter neustonicus]TPE60467.1 AbrB/MazE/SpoVT family DNA-binding domain-containing protein [Sandaracinobacter neustonicus]
MNAQSGIGKTRSTKVFKSGNSKAVRLPADYPLELGQEVIVREEHGRYVIEPVLSAEARREALMATFGSVPGLKPIPPEDREFEERELPWHLLGIKLD